MRTMGLPLGYTSAQGMSLKKVQGEELELEVSELQHWEECEGHGCWQPPSLPEEGKRGPRLQPGKTWQGHLGHQMTWRRRRQVCWQWWWGAPVEANDVIHL